MIAVDGAERMPEDGQRAVVEPEGGEQETEIVEIPLPVVPLRPVGVPVPPLIRRHHPPAVTPQDSGERREVRAFTEMPVQGE